MRILKGRISYLVKRILGFTALFGITRNTRYDVLMKVRVLYFATCREIFGQREQEIDLREGASVNDLIEALSSQASTFREMERSLMVSVNQAYVARDRALEDGDEVALIPPVSGGR